MAPDIKPRRRARANARTKRNPPMKIVYHAALEEGSTSLQRLRSFRALDGVEVIAHDSNARMSKAGTLYQRIRWRLGWPTDNFHENERLLAFVAEIRPDVVFVDNCKVIRRSTLRAMRDLGARRLVYYSPDDMMNPMNMKWPLRLSMPEWDVVFTTKSFNVPELRALGARNPREIGNAYDPTLHRSLSAAEVGEEFERFDLVFAGASEAARHRSINALGEAGFSVVIYGGDLGNWDTQKLHPLVECRPAAFGPAALGPAALGPAAFGPATAGPVPTTLWLGNHLIGPYPPSGPPPSGRLGPAGPPPFPGVFSSRNHLIVSAVWSGNHRMVRKPSYGWVAILSSRGRHWPPSTGQIQHPGRIRAEAASRAVLSSRPIGPCPAQHAADPSGCVRGGWGAGTGGGSDRRSAGGGGPKRLSGTHYREEPKPWPSKHSNHSMVFKTSYG